jgi:hypothetical protein
MPKDTNALVTSILLTAVAGCLRPDGFRRRGRQFERKLNDLVHIIHLQKSTSSNAEMVIATLNVSMFVPVLSPGTPVSEVGSHYRSRIGELMPERNDFWWEACSEAEAEHAGSTMCYALVSFALPVLNKFTCARDLLAHWETGRSEGITDRQRQMYMQRLRVALKS